ncbi:upstream-binding factor 1-like protein 1 [Thalassophryne amazonica]|uniref:upstream-binding factor 1-like protein 1 n=1 Tax=Thalassophryne amazonica TaxID=390379 RepID=UPI0014712743|nr:upstream-binding factor 1-like protein 1 [Thalassophryne amazonica]
METKPVVWTNENVLMMLHAMKDNIPERNRMNAYLKTQNSLDWNKVAFNSFSPEECRQKWEGMLRKMRKVRTLTELIDEAASAFTEPSRNTKIHLEKPKKPPGPFAIYMKENMAGFRKNHPDVTARELLKLLNKEYKTLPLETKAIYVGKFQLASETYQQNVVEFRKQYPKGLLSYKYLKMQKRKRAAKNDSLADRQAAM